MIGRLSRTVGEPSSTARSNVGVPASTQASRRSSLRHAKRTAFPLDVSFRNLKAEHRELIFEGDPDGDWGGVRGFFDRLQKEDRTSARIFVAKYRGWGNCSHCRGTRLGTDARNVRFAGIRISDIWQMSLDDALAFFRDTQFDDRTRQGVGVLLDEVETRLRYLCEIGLGYLTLDRPSKTLSGGEVQRIALTTSIGRALTDTLYVLDEPTAGLHARDSQRLLGVLANLRDLGNTVVVVEHDPEIIEGADYVVELGPQGGENGGELIFDGPFDEFASSDTLTARSLTTRIPICPKNADEPVAMVSIIEATENNLDGIDVHFPVGRMTALTGVSGSGKSTLMHSVLYNGWRRARAHVTDVGACQSIDGLERFDSVIFMDQAALGRSSRSNPLSYSKAYEDVRRMFAGTEAARVAGLNSGDFSFNTPGGRCEHCAGLGYVIVEMHFLADVSLECEECHGARFGKRVLDVKYRGASIRDVLEMTVDEALALFGDHTRIVGRLQPLIDVGLGYLRMGQSTATLSGGEAQRLKLAGYLSESYMADDRSMDAPEYFFIFDEPTVGLHIRDVAVLVEALRKLVDQGHTAVVIEHNIDFIAQCDYMIDLGPGAGPDGGQIVAAGTPERVALDGVGHTARHLFEYFEDIQRG